ncbi:MAG: ferrous iron transport protein A [Bacilli bacterium]|jgi:ferrous iron transport protein A|nr:ferrous iron transport protein A [Bacilli bacterium]
MPIALAPLDTEMRVVKVLLDEKTKKHLESLGILVNSSIRIISSVNGGVVVAVKEGRLALDRSLASKILVA